MQDPAFKRLFRHPATIEVMVRTYAPERASDIDFSTLRKLSAEQIGGALVRRYPDMLWTVRTRDDGARVIILLEFQGTRDRFMALRIAVYSLLAVQELFRRDESARAECSVDVLSFVIYHGSGHWTPATNLSKLFKRWVPGGYRVISRNLEASRRAPEDLPQTILKLEQDRSVEGTLAAVEAMRRVAEATGSEYDQFMAACVVEMLVSGRRITREQMREASTMAQVATAYQRSLEEYGKRWFRQGRDEGIRQGRDEGIRHQATMLRRQVRKKFGTETAEELSALLHQAPESACLTEAAIMVIECATADEFLTRMRRISSFRS